MFANVKHFPEMTLFVSDGPPIHSEMYNLGCNYMISRSCNCVGVHTVPHIVTFAVLYFPKREGTLGYLLH